MMLNGKLIIDELLIILFFFTLSLFPVEARTTSGNGQKVLVISSYSPSIDKWKLRSTRKWQMRQPRRQVCSRVTLYCNKVKLFKSMCLCVRKDVWVIFEQHLLRWSSNAWGELKVKSEEKMHHIDSEPTSRQVCQQTLDLFGSHIHLFHQ